MLLSAVEDRETVIHFLFFFSDAHPSFGRSGRSQFKSMFLLNWRSCHRRIWQANCFARHARECEGSLFVFTSCGTECPISSCRAYCKVFVREGAQSQERHQKRKRGERGIVPHPSAWLGNGTILMTQTTNLYFDQQYWPKSFLSELDGVAVALHFPGKSKRRPRKAPPTMFFVPEMEHMRAHSEWRSNYLLKAFPGVHACRIHRRGLIYTATTAALVQHGALSPKDNTSYNTLIRIIKRRRPGALLT